MKEELIQTQKIVENMMGELCSLITRCEAADICETDTLSIAYFALEVAFAKLDEQITKIIMAEAKEMED